MFIYLSMINTEQDKRKFEQIYLNYKKTMFYVANRILKNPATSEDAVHQAFLRIIDHLDKIDEVESYKTKAFLITIVENIAIDFYRKNKRQNTISYDEVEVYVKDENAITNALGTTTLDAISNLPINYSIVLKLKFSQGYTDNEIAKILDISEENVRQRISRGKKKLAKLLSKDEEGDYE